MHAHGFVPLAITLCLAVEAAGCSGTTGAGLPAHGPPAPTSLTANPGDRQAVLAWNGSAGATSYTIKRGTTASGPYADIGTTARTYLYDAGLTNGTRYYYVVAAANAAGVSRDSNEASVVPAAYPGSVYYVATDGSDSGDGSSAHPWATFAHAASRMHGGDTLLIKDGVYHERILARDDVPGTIPSGSPAGYTLVKAEHDWQVTVYGRMRIAASYLQVQGIRFVNQPEDLRGNHLKFIRCSFRGDVCTDNTSVVSLGSGSSYVLFEECFAFGCGRYKFLVFADTQGATENVILRRCVSRHDYHDTTTQPDGSEGWGRQCAAFTSYTAHNFVMQNCIAIDSGDEDARKYGNLYGGLWVENKMDSGLDNSMAIQDSIFFNIGGGQAIQDPNVNGDRVIENSVIWHSEGGLYGGVRANHPTLRLDHMTIGDIWGTFVDYARAQGVGVTIDTTFAGMSYASATIGNSVISGCRYAGILDLLTSDHNDFWNNARNYGGWNGIPAPAAGAHDTTFDPGLRYLFRVEDGSPAKGAASDGKDLGARILYRRGVSGTLYGEPGWDDLTDQPLWPFPNEAVIKADMSAWDGAGFTTTDPNALNVPKRGFCADGNGLYGGPITLTSYLWEALGNPCPQDICPR